MYLSDEGLNAIEKAADKKRSPDTLLLVQILREVRELSAVLKQQNHARYGGDNGANRAYNCDNQ